MVKNCCILLGTLVMALVMPWHIKAMEEQVVSKNERDRIQATFELGQMWALGEGGDKDYSKARECFAEVIKADIDKEASVWSYLWLSKISFDQKDKEDAQKYLERATPYAKGIPFTSQLATFLQKDSNRTFGKDIFLVGVQKGNLRVLKFLLACGVEIDFSECLHCAALMGYKDFCECKKNAIGKDLGSNYKSIICWLLENGAEIGAQDGEGRTLLHYAAQFGYKDLVKLLLKRGASIEAKNNNGQTVFLSAVEVGFNDIVKLLLESGADINAQDNHGWAALHYAANDNDKDMVDILLKNGADIEARDSSGYTALQHVTECEDIDMIKLLLDGGACVKGKDGESVLYWASYLTDKELVRLLVSSEIDRDKDSYNTTTLHNAVLRGSKYIARLLLEHGADIESQDKDGLTALHIGVIQGHKDIVEFLLDRGVDKRIKDNDNKTALNYASEKGYKEIEEILLKK